MWTLKSLDHMSVLGCDWAGSQECIVLFCSKGRLLPECVIHKGLLHTSRPVYLRRSITLLKRLSQGSRGSLYQHAEDHLGHLFKHPPARPLPSTGPAISDVLSLEKDNDRTSHLSDRNVQCGLGQWWRDWLNSYKPHKSLKPTCGNSISCFISTYFNMTRELPIRVTALLFPS